MYKILDRPSKLLFIFDDFHRVLNLNPNLARILTSISKELKPLYPIQFLFIFNQHFYDYSFLEANGRAEIIKFPEKQKKD